MPSTIQGTISYIKAKATVKLDQLMLANHTTNASVLAYAVSQGYLSQSDYLQWTFPIMTSCASEDYIGPQPILVCLDDGERDIRTACNKTLRKLGQAPVILSVRWASHDGIRGSSVIRLTDQNTAPMLRLLKARGGIDTLVID